MKKERKEKHFIHKPIYKGGPKAMKAFVKQHLRYPEEARKADIKGSVHVRYSINKKGVVTDVKIISGLGYGCDEEAIRVIKMLRFDIPKNRKGKIIFHKKMAVHFRPKKEDKPKKTKIKTSTPNQVSYKITKKEKPKEDNEKPSGGNGYSYTIKW